MALTEEDAEDRHSVRVRPSVLRLLAYLLLAAVMLLGFWKIQDTADEAHDVATAFAEAEAREDLEEDQERKAGCLIRNRALRNGRERFTQFRDNLAGLFGQSDNPERAAQIQKALFAGIVLDPSAEDIDCNDDGQLDERDYAP
jgi:hypothetical protein